jgi:hypothetical protein
LEQEKINLKNKIKTRDRQINNLKIEHIDAIAKIEKKYKDFIEIREGRKSDLEHDLTDSSTIIIHKGKRYVRINHGDRQMQPYVYTDKEEIRSTNVEPPFNVYVNLDEILEREPFDFKLT